MSKKANSLYEFACNELKELDEKAQAGDLSIQDVQFGDVLEHYKKSVLTNRAMEQQGYSARNYGNGGSYDNGMGGESYRDQPRDSQGRYVASYADHSLAQGLRNRAAMERDQRSRMDMERMADHIERGA